MLDSMVKKEILFQPTLDQQKFRELHKFRRKKLLLLQPENNNKSIDFEERYQFG